MSIDAAEVEAVEALAPEREQCAQRVLEFMAACGVRVTVVPPQLLELLTVYGFQAIDIGKALAHKRRTIPFSEPPAIARKGHAGPGEHSGVLSGVGRAGAPFDDPTEITREVEPARPRQRRRTR